MFASKEAKSQETSCQESGSKEEASCQEGRLLEADPDPWLKWIDFREKNPTACAGNKYSGYRTCIVEVQVLKRLWNMELTWNITGRVEYWKSDKSFYLNARRNGVHMQEPNFQSMEQGQTTWIQCVFCFTLEQSQNKIEASSKSAADLQWIFIILIFYLYKYIFVNGTFYNSCHKYAILLIMIILNVQRDHKKCVQLPVVSTIYCCSDEI